MKPFRKVCECTENTTAISSVVVGNPLSRDDRQTHNGRDFISYLPAKKPSGGGGLPVTRLTVSDRPRYGSLGSRNGFQPMPAGHER